MEGAEVNRAIAEELFISEKTASVHVSNIMAKLGLAQADDDDHRRVLVVLAYLKARQQQTN